MRDRLASIRKTTIEIDAKVNTKAFEATSKALEKTAFTGSALQRAYDGVGIASENLGKKSESAFGKMTDKLKTVQDSAENVRGAIEAVAGLAITGAIGGLTWSAADKSQDKTQTFKEILSRKKFDTSAVSGLVADMSSTGLTSSSDMYSLITDISNKSKKVRPETAMNAAKMLTLGYANSKDALESMGYSSAESVESALSQKYIRGVNRQQEIDALAETMGYSGSRKFSKLSQERRLKEMAKFEMYKTDSTGAAIRDENGNPIKLSEAELKEQARKRNMPEVVSNRISNLGKAIGGELLGPMDKALQVVEKIVLALQSIPGGTKFLALASVFVGFVGALTAIAAVVPSVTAGLQILGIISAKNAVSATAETAATNMSTLAKIRAAVVSKLLAASNYLLGTSLTVALGPIGIAIAAIAALGAILYAVEKKTHIFSKTWQALKEGRATKFLMDAAGGTISFLAEEGNELLADILEWIKKIVSFVGWILEKIQGFIGWIRDGLGITRQQAKKKVDDYAADKGYWWSDKKNAWVKSASDSTQVNDPKLARLQEKYEKAPKGFFEGIPGINELTKAIRDLIAALKVDVVETATNAGNANIDEYNKRKEDLTKKGIGEGTASKAAWRPWWMPGGGLYAKGAKFDRTGFFQGIVHAGEEIPDLATVRSGPGIISKAISSLRAAQDSGEVSGRGQTVINNYNYNVNAPMNIDKVSKEVDYISMHRSLTDKLDEVFTRKARQAGN